MKADDLSEEILSAASEIWHELTPNQRELIISLLVRTAYDNIRAQVRPEREETCGGTQPERGEDQGAS